MENQELVGYLIEYYAGDETKEEVTRADLTSMDKEKIDLVKRWVAGLANPWSQSALSYTLNYIDWNPEIPENKRWVAKCYSIFYDTLESVAISCGATPKDALQNVQDFVKYVIDNFYEKEDEE